MKSTRRLSLFYASFFLFVFSGIAQTVPQGFNLVVYEGFDYTAGSSLLNANGGTGWTGPWSKAYMDKYFKTSTTGFTYPGLTTTGLKAEFDNTCYGSCNAIAALRRSFPLQSKGVVYFQFISVFEANAGGGTPNIRLFSEGTLTGGVGASSGSVMSILDASLSNVASSTGSLSAQNLVVVRVDHSLNKTEMWINPDLSSFDYSNPTNPSASELGFSPSFDRMDIFIRSGSVDEITIFSQIDSFITTWQTDAADKITIPLFGFGYDFSIDWGDGSIETYSGSPGNISHTYLSSGIKTIGITPNTLTGFPRIYVNNSAALRDNLLSIESWGSGRWGSTLKDAFNGAKNLEVKATDVPDFSATTDFQSMFRGCTSITGENGFTDWDVSSATNMYYMFYNANVFNSDISGWDVSSVTNMSSMFTGAHVFNSDISDWNVSSVTNMSGMFTNARVFNSDITDWNVSSVSDMSGMFFNAHVFNSDITDWNVSSVTNMSSMFFSASVFNSDISGWDVSKVTNMSRMFYGCGVFNSSIGGWDVSNVTNMYFMFANASIFNSDISGWDVSKVINLSFMFNGTNFFNSEIGSWDVSNVTSMDYMFYNARVFNQNLSNWNVLNVTNMSYMFFNARVFNSDISGWDVSKVTNMQSMFYNALAFNQNLSNWNVSKVTNMSSMFRNATSIDQEFGAWDISSLTNATNFMVNVKLSRKNYDNTLVGWQTLDVGETKIPVNLSLNFGSSNYSNNTSVISARTDLTEGKNWSISDGGMVSVLTNNGELSGSHTININRNGALGGRSGVSSNGRIIP